MAIIKIESEKQWHDLRAKHIGASEIAGLMGCSPWNTPNQLYMDKRDFVHHEVSGPLIEFGKAMEPVIAAMIEAENGWKVEKSGMYYEHPDYPFLGCTLDYDILEAEDGPGLLEIKNAIIFAPKWHKEHAPEHIEWQLQQQLFVVNAARKAEGLKPYQYGAIGSMHGGNPEDMRVMKRPPNPDAQAKIVTRASKFWNETMKLDTPPDLEPKDYDYIGDVFKTAAPITTPLDLKGREDVDTLFARFLQAREDSNAAEKLVKEYKAKIMHELLLVDEGDLKAHLTAITDKYRLEFKMLEVNYKPQPARTTTQARLTIKAA